MGIFDRLRGTKPISDNLLLNEILTALDDASPQVRSTAARKLSKTNDPRVVVALTKLLMDPDTKVCISAAEALEEIGDPMSVKPLINCLRPDTSVNLVLVVKRVLRKFGDDAVEPLIEAILSGKSARLRGTAALILGNIKSEKAKVGLETLLRNQNEDFVVRAIAAHSLQNITGKHYLDEFQAKASLLKILRAVKAYCGDVSVLDNLDKGIDSIRLQNAANRVALMSKLSHLGLTALSNVGNKLKESAETGPHRIDLSELFDIVQDAPRMRIAEFHTLRFAYEYALLQKIDEIDRFEGESAWTSIFDGCPFILKERINHELKTYVFNYVTQNVIDLCNDKRNSKVLNKSRTAKSQISQESQKTPFQALAGQYGDLGKLIAIELYNLSFNTKTELRLLYWGEDI